MASPAPPFLGAPPTPSSHDAPAAPPCRPDASPTLEAQATLPDHLTEDILLRLTTAADLARASMAGPSLRRVVADHSFLRRFRTLHPPPLLGILSDSFLPAQPPHPSAAAARTLAGTDFSCSFLPSREQPWRRCDFRDGRALLCVATNGLALVRDVAVCDPLHRRYLLLPPVPHQDLADLVHHWELFLAPASAGGDIGADAPFRFRVMCLAEYQTHLVLFIFSSSGTRAGQWHTVTFDGWTALVAGITDHAFGRRYYAHGSFCWAIPGIDKLLMLDTGTMEFSSLNLGPDLRGRQVAFVEAKEGRLGMFALNHNPVYDSYHLWYRVLFSTGDGPRQWLTDDVVPLPHDYSYYILGVAGGYLLLHGIPDDDPDSFPSFEMPEPNCFSLNLQTLKVERFCGSELMMPLQGQLYAAFPPSLSPPTI